MEDHNGTWQNDSRGFYGLRIHEFNVLGTIGLVLFTFVFIRFGLDATGVQPSNWIALIATISIVALRSVLKRRKRARNLRKAFELRKTVSKLEQDETALRIEEARQSGAFEKWEKPQ